MTQDYRENRVKTLLLMGMFMAGVAMMGSCKSGGTPGVYRTAATVPDGTKKPLNPYADNVTPEASPPRIVSSAPATNRVVTRRVLKDFTQTNSIPKHVRIPQCGMSDAAYKKMMSERSGKDAVR